MVGEGRSRRQEGCARVCTSRKSPPLVHVCVCVLPETGQGDDGLVEPPGGDQVFPDGVGGVVPPGSLVGVRGQGSEVRGQRSEVRGQRAYLDQAGCRVSALLKVLLSVLILDLQSQTGSQDPLRTQQGARERQAGRTLTRTLTCTPTAGRAKKETPMRAKVPASRRPAQVLGVLSP